MCAYLLSCSTVIHQLVCAKIHAVTATKTRQFSPLVYALTNRRHSHPDSSPLLLHFAVENAAVAATHAASDAHIFPARNPYSLLPKIKISYTRCSQLSEENDRPLCMACCGAIALRHSDHSDAGAEKPHTAANTVALLSPPCPPVIMFCAG